MLSYNKYILCLILHGKQRLEDERDADSQIIHGLGSSILFGYQGDENDDAGTYNTRTSICYRVL